MENRNAGRGIDFGGLGTRNTYFWYLNHLSSMEECLSEFVTVAPSSREQRG